jgi:iron-sulfur cluster assembly 1
VTAAGFAYRYDNKQTNHQPVMSMQSLLRSQTTRVVSSQSWRRSLLTIARGQHDVTRRKPEQQHFFFSTASANRQQSSAAVAVNNKTKRRSLADKNPITFTDRAAERIRMLLQNQPANVVGLRLGVQRRGCNGLSYTLNYKSAADDGDNAPSSNKKDLEMESHGIRVFIDPMALLNIVGTEMDWEETELASEFTFHNPNSKGQCGCGESFTV